MKYLVDTNILLSHPEFIQQPDCDILIAYKVICELDSKKYEPGTIGLASRTVSRWLDESMKMGALEEGVVTSYGNTVYVIMDDSLDMPTDDALVQIGLQLQAVGTEFTLLSNDVNVRIKASVSGLVTMGWGGDLKEMNQSQCLPEILVPDYLIDEAYSAGSLDLDPEWKVGHNTYLMLRSDQRHNATVVCRCDGDRLVVVLGKRKMYGMTHRNVDQMCAIDALSRDLPLITLVGKAGSGKTILAVAAALDALLEKKSVDKVLFVRPPIAMGADIGFLPGPLTLSTPVLTPTGWSTMGEVKEGDLVIGRNGKPTKVLGKFAKGKRETFNVHTADGAVVTACGEHVWQTHTYNERKHNKEPKLRTTLDILETLTVEAQEGKSKGKVRFNHFLPRVEPVHFTPTTLPIPPYTLGVLLGDGSICNSMSFASKDKGIVERVTSEMESFGCRITPPSVEGQIGYRISNKDSVWSYNNKTAKRVTATNIETGHVEIYRSVGIAAEQLGVHRATLGSRCVHNSVVDGVKFGFLDAEMRWTNKLKNEITSLGLLDLCAPVKFIPDQYKYGSTVEERLALLQGLMDTDGTIKKNGESSFCTTSKRLADDVKEIVQSLGGKAVLAKPRNRIGKTSVYKGKNITTRRISYEFNITLQSMNPFHLPRKAERHISATDNSNRKRPFMHGNAVTAVVPNGMEEVVCILVEDPEHLFVVGGYTVTHNTQQDKMAAWGGSLADNLQVLMNGKAKNLDFLVESGAIEVVPPTFMRGRSLNRTFVILDEGQSLTRHEMKTIATRIGEGSRLIVTGDLDQIDNPRVSSSSNGLAVLVEAFSGTEWASCINLIKGERSDFSSVAADRL